MLRRLTWLGVLLALIGSACIHMLKAKEVLEGSEAWINELTQGMTITVEHPEGEVPLYEPYNLIIRVENHDGKHEPHLSTAMVEVFRGPEEGLDCALLEPSPLDTQPFPGGVLFYMSPEKVERGDAVTIRIRCAFTQPGTYEVYLSAAFRESGKDFAGRAFTVIAR